MKPEILGFDYVKQNGEYSAECEGYHDDDRVLHITNIYRWNQTIEHNDKEGV